MSNKVAYQPNAQELAALRAYAKANGQCWKSRLGDDWLRCQPAGPLIALRNRGGPSWLMSYKLAKEEK